MKNRIALASLTALLIACGTSDDSATDVIIESNHVRESAPASTEPASSPSPAAEREDEERCEATSPSSGSATVVQVVTSIDHVIGFQVVASDGGTVSSAIEVNGPAFLQRCDAGEWVTEFMSVVSRTETVAAVSRYELGQGIAGKSYDATAPLFITLPEQLIEDRYQYSLALIGDEGGQRVFLPVDSAAAFSTMVASTTTVAVSSTTLVEEETDPLLRYDAPLGGGEEALIEGALTLQSGCLVLVQPDGVMRPVLWPGGTKWEPELEQVELTNGVVLPIGSPFRAGGGYVSGDGASDGVPATCSELATGSAAVVQNSVEKILTES